MAGEGRSADWQRQLDRLVGEPLLRALTWVRPPHPSFASNEPATIGAIQPSAIGDTVLASGLIHRLWERWPDAHILFFAGANNTAAAELIAPRLDVRTVDARRPLATVRRFRAADVDLLIDLTPWARITALEVNLGTRGTTAGYSCANQGKRACYGVTSPHSATRHELENLDALATAVTGIRAPLEPSLRGPLQPVAGEYDWDSTILVHPWPGGSRADAKRWPLVRWVELIRALRGRGFTIGITGAAEDATGAMALLSEVGDPGDRVFSVAGQWRLSQLAWALQRVRLFISVDTGVMHLASVLGAPVLALHGPTAPGRWGPRGERARAIASHHPAAGYLSLGFERHPEALAIMEAISTFEVISVTDAMLQG